MILKMIWPGQGWHVDATDSASSRRSGSRRARRTTPAQLLVAVVRTSRSRTYRCRWAHASTNVACGHAVQRQWVSSEIVSGIVADYSYWLADIWRRWVGTSALQCGECRGRAALAAPVVLGARRRLARLPPGRWLPRRRACCACCAWRTAQWKMTRWRRGGTSWPHTWTRLWTTLPARTSSCPMAETNDNSN